MPRDIQLLFVVPPLSKGRNVEVVDNVCANSCELTAYIALRVSPSLSLSVFPSLSSSLLSSIRCFARYDLVSFFLLRTLLRLTLFFSKLLLLSFLLASVFSIGYLFVFIATE